MLAGIIGDVIGSVYEGRQWTVHDQELIQPLPVDDSKSPLLLKNTKWVRPEYSWTDDSLCTLALYSAFLNKQNPTTALIYFCKKYETEATGFGRSFKQWIKNPVPYQSFGNGSIMRVGFIPHLKISLHEKLHIGVAYTNISHNHSDSINAVLSFIKLTHQLINGSFIDMENKKLVLKNILLKNGFYETVESMHALKKFEINAMTTFLQACAIVYESKNFEDVLKNSFYVGGDSDTLACVACNIAEHIYPIPAHLLEYSLKTFENYPELNNLIQRFQSSCCKLN